MKTETIDTGIFVEVKNWPDSTEESEALLEEYFNRFSKITIYTILDELEKFADWVFKSHGVTRKTRVELDTPKKIKDTMRSPIIRDAQRLLAEVSSCRSRLKKGDADNIGRADAEWAAMEAYWAGQTYLKMTVRPYEPAAKTGHKVHDFYAKGRQVKNQKASKRHSKVIETFHSIFDSYEPHERPSDREIIKEVAKHHKMEFDTVKSIIYRASKKTAE